MNKGLQFLKTSKNYKLSTVRGVKSALQMLQEDTAWTVGIFSENLHWRISGKDEERSSFNKYLKPQDAKVTHFVSMMQSGQSY